MKNKNRLIFKDSSGRMIHYNSKKVPVSIDIQKILFIKGDGSYVKVYTEGQAKGISITCMLCNMEVVLKENDFIRCHRSLLVNVNKIDAFIKKKMILIVSKYGIPVSRKCWNELKWVLADNGIEFIQDIRPEIKNIMLKRQD